MGRTPCCEKNGLKKGPWTSEEDHKLMDYIQKHGHGSWRTLPKNAGLSRCGKSCRLRWTNYLRPDIKRGRFSFDEEETIIQLHSILGNKWSAIAARLPGRTDNEIKNYWNTHIRKRLLRMGIDPVTHSHRLDLLNLSSLLTNPNLMFNTQAQFDISKLLGMESLQVNPELLRIAANLLSSQSHHSNPFLLQNQFQQVPSCTPSDPQFFNINDLSQLMQPNQFQPNVDTWQTSGVKSNFPENIVPVTTRNTIGFENLEQSDTLFVPDNANFYLSNNQSHDNCTTNSVMSTPILSPLTQLNSSSTYISGSTEEERDSYCSEIFNFHIPESLDVSDYM